jgi:UDP-glucuronate 4-epimerase
LKESILITGSAGFIGSHLSEQLLSRGYRIIGIDNFDTFYDPAIKKKNIARLLEHPSYSFREGDIRDSHFLDDLFATKIDKIIHLAARAGVRPSIQQPLLYEDVNIRGTLNLLEKARDGSVRQFIFASSSSVYGGNRKIPFSESDRVDSPVSPYAATKKSGELFCFYYHHLYKISVTCLRFFTVYGPRQRPEMAISSFARAIIDEKELSVYGDGTIKRDFTYIDDIIDGVVRSLECPFGFEIFNLGESKNHEVGYVIELLSKLIGKSAKIRYLPPEAGDMSVTLADIQKARNLLGYNPKVSLEKGLANFVSFLMQKSS